LNLRYVDKMRFSWRAGVLQERVLRITARRGDAPKIKKIEDPDGLLDYEVLEPQGAMASIRLKIREAELQALTQEARLGVHKMIVYTSDKEEPRIEFEYTVAASAVTAKVANSATGAAPAPTSESTKK
jgi:hypothetical protein